MHLFADFDGRRGHVDQALRALARIRRTSRAAGLYLLLFWVPF